METKENIFNIWNDFFKLIKKDKKNFSSEIEMKKKMMKNSLLS